MTQVIVTTRVYEKQASKFVYRYTSHDIHSMDFYNYMLEINARRAHEKKDGDKSVRIVQKSNNGYIRYYTYNGTRYKVEYTFDFVVADEIGAGDDLKKLTGDQDIQFSLDGNKLQKSLDIMIVTYSGVYFATNNGRVFIEVKTSKCTDIILSYADLFNAINNKQYKAIEKEVQLTEEQLQNNELFNAPCKAVLMFTKSNIRMAYSKAIGFNNYYSDVQKHSELLNNATIINETIDGGIFKGETTLFKRIYKIGDVYIKEIEDVNGYFDYSILIDHECDFIIEGKPLHFNTTLTIKSLNNNDYEISTRIHKALNKKGISAVKVENGVMIDTKNQSKAIIFLDNYLINDIGFTMVNERVDQVNDQDVYTYTFKKC